MPEEEPGEQLSARSAGCFVSSINAETPNLQDSPKPCPARPNQFLYLERELVDGVDLVEVTQDEVQQGCSLCRWPVVFSSDIYLDFGDFSFFHLDTQEGGCYPPSWHVLKQHPTSH